MTIRTRNLAFLANEPACFSDDAGGGGEGFVHQRFLLIVVYFVGACGGAGGGGAAYVAQLTPVRSAVVAGVDDRLHLLFHEVPGSHVFRLFLYPEEFGGVGVAMKNVGQLPEREGVKLLDANDSDIVAPQFLALVDQVVVDLAGAQQNAADLVAEEV